MAKGDDKRVRSNIDAEQSRLTAQHDLLQDRFLNLYQDSNQRNQNTYDEVHRSLSEFRPRYNADDYLGAAGYTSGGGGISSGGAGGTAINIRGGLDPGKIDSYGSEAYGGYREMAGGLKQPFWDDYRKFEGGLNESSASARNFIETGGFSAGDLDNIRARSLAPTRQIYQSGEDALARNKAASGVQGNSAAALIKMNRERNQAISDVATDTEANIAQQVREGRQYGTSQLANNSIAGMDARTQVEALDQQMRAQGLGGMTDIEKMRLQAQLENAQLNQNADIASAQIAESAASRGASASGASAAQRLAEANFRAGLDVEGNNQFLASRKGLTDLYGTTPGATALGVEALLQMQGLRQSGQRDLINSRIMGAQLPGRFASAMGNISSALGPIGRFTGMFGGG